MSDYGLIINGNKVAADDSFPVVNPFGGVKCSGIGVEFGKEGLQEYTIIQVVNISRAAA